MKQRNFVEKSKFGPGPWQEEADSYTWVDKETGYDCAIWRTPEMGNLCGYVGIKKGHPLFEKDYNDKETESFGIHWGLTFSGFIDPHGRTQIGREDFKTDLWYFGFDCAHAYDLVPCLNALFGNDGYGTFGEAYRDADYVKHHVEILAKQVKISELKDLQLRINENRKLFRK